MIENLWKLQKSPTQGFCCIYSTTIYVLSCIIIHNVQVSLKEFFIWDKGSVISGETCQSVVSDIANVHIILMSEMYVHMVAILGSQPSVLLTDLTC